MRFPTLVTASFAAAALALSAATASAETFITAVWSGPAVHVLDGDLNSLRSFAAGASSPNGIATDGSTIWTGHFSTEEVVAYNYSGTELYRWSGTLFLLQGMEYVDGDLAILRGDIEFYNPATGAFIRSIPGQGGLVEGIAYDGSQLWLLNSTVIWAVSPVDGSVIRSIPNPAIDDPFGGTGLTHDRAGSLYVGAGNGNWYQISDVDGSLIRSGNNGLDMFGLKIIPEPASASLLLAGAMGFLRRRR